MGEDVSLCRGHSSDSPFVQSAEIALERRAFPVCYFLREASGGVSAQSQEWAGRARCDRREESGTPSPRTLTAPPQLTDWAGWGCPPLGASPQGDGGGPGMGRFLAAASPAALVQRLAPFCS